MVFAETRQAHMAQEPAYEPAQAHHDPPTHVLRNEDIGFFDPDLEDKGLGVTTTGKHTIYKDVFAFTDWLKHLAAINSESRVRDTLPTCLRGAALVWHSTELSEHERDLMITDSLDSIVVMLVRRFKKHVVTAMTTLAGEKITLVDIKSGKNLNPLRILVNCLGFLHILRLI